MKELLHSIVVTVSALDTALFEKINKDWHHPLLDLVMPFITDFHKTPYFVVAILFFWILVHRKLGWRGSALLFSAVLVVGCLDFFGSQVIKPFFARLRPGVDGAIDVVARAPHFGGYSFLSNHATNMFGLAGFLAKIQRPWAVPLFIFAFLAAYSRVYVGVHYPLDVLGGGLWGVAWGLIAAHYFQAWSKKRWPLSASHSESFHRSNHEPKGTKP